MDPPAATLKLIYCFAPTDADAEAFRAGVRRAFTGGLNIAGDYLTPGDDLGFPIKEFSSAPGSGIDFAAELDGSQHTLLVVAGGEKLLSETAWTRCLEDIAKAIQQSNGRHALRLIDMNARAAGRRKGFGTEFGGAVGLVIEETWEYALRPAYAALWVLHEARALLLRGLGEQNPKLRLFLSHAKRDGLPLAAALRFQIQALRFLEKFYDAEDLLAGKKLDEQLEAGVLDSMVLVLRTDIFDERPWCRWEVLKAEEHAKPMVIVEARTQLVHSASALPVSTAPWIRVPDGNVLRILAVALREAVRVAAGQRMVHALQEAKKLSKQGVVFLPRTPSILALVRSSRRMRQQGASNDALLLYPDPPLDTAAHEAALSVWQSYFGKGRLLTLREYLALP